MTFRSTTLFFRVRDHEILGVVRDKSRLPMTGTRDLVG